MAIDFDDYMDRLPEKRRQTIKQRAAELTAAAPGSGSIGAMREDAELLDAIVADAMRRRQMQAWCPSPEDFAEINSHLGNLGTHSSAPRRAE